MNTPKTVFVPIFSQLILYTLQFLILPPIISVYSTDAERTFWIIFISTVVVSIISMWFFSDRFRWWLVGLITYPILTYMYHPGNIYGIGGSPLDIYGGLISVITLTFIVFCCELTVWGIVKLSRLLQREYVKRHMESDFLGD